MNVLLLFLIAILIGSIIVIAISANKKKKEEEPPVEICNKYIYNNTCVDSCGDKYVDEKTRTCYDAIPKGKFAFDKKIVSSCDDKYTDGQLCVLDCGDKYVDESKKTCYDAIPSGKFADGKKIVEICDINKYVDGRECVSDCFNRDVNKVIEGKNCIKDCDKFLHFGVNNNNVIEECKDSCNSYYINDKLKRISSHSKYCLSPIITPFIGMSNLFINSSGNKFIVDLEDLPNEKLFLQNTEVVAGTQNKELLPLLLKGTENIILKKFVVSPDSNNYGVVYEDHIDLYKDDIFDGNYPPLVVINPSDITIDPLMEGAIIEDCIMYDDLNLLVLLRKINQNNQTYGFYHVYINTLPSVSIKSDIIGSTFLKPLGENLRLYNAIKTAKVSNVQNLYNIAYVEEFLTITPPTIEPSYITYTFTTNFLTPQTSYKTLQQNKSSLYTININNGIPEEQLVDFKVSKNFGIVLTNIKNITPNQLNMTFISFSNKSYQDQDNAINSKFIAVTNDNKAYYSKYNNDKTISIWEAIYDESNVNDIPTTSNIYTFTGSYTDPYVSLVSNLEGTLLLCSITEKVDDNIPTRKELHKINLTASPISSELLISS